VTLGAGEEARQGYCTSEPVEIKSNGVENYLLKVITEFFNIYCLFLKDLQVIRPFIIINLRAR
jgi:hypothetical protein